jgi:hypothetical protein
MFSASFAVRRGAPAVVTAVSAVALAALTAACGSSAGTGAAAPTGTATAVPAREVTAVSTLSPTAPSAGVPSVGPAKAGAGKGGAAKLSGSVVTALLNEAIADTEAATSVRVTGQYTIKTTGKTTGQAAAVPMLFDMTLVRDVGCVGTEASSKTQAYRMIRADGTLWMLPGSSLYASLKTSKKVQAEVAGKYLKFTAGATPANDTAPLCTVVSMLSSVPKPTGKDFTAVPVTYDGAPAYAVTEAGKSETVYITDTKQPLLLRLAPPLDPAGTVMFSGYNEFKAIAVPSAAEVVTSQEVGG